MQDETRKRRKIKQKLCEDRISALPDDLLVTILLLLSTVDAVATTILSKRWRSVWTMLPRLEYSATRDEGDESVWWFIDKSLLQLSKAPVLEKLRIRLGPSCPVNIDVGKWVDNVVDRCIRFLDFSLRWSAEPTSLSKRLYTCKTLKKLTLSNKILVDVLPQASLPSLVDLKLYYVIYKDEDSLARLLSSCPLLQNLNVKRYHIGNDNVTNVIVKVPSLKVLKYTHYNRGGSLVIDSPGLKIFKIIDGSVDTWLIESMPPCLDMAKVDIDSHPNDKFMRSLSSVMHLNLTWMDATEAICSAIKFPRLIECKLSPFYSEYWLKSIMHLLHNSPQLKVLMINSDYTDNESEDLPILSSVPECLSSRLEIFEWEKYGGTREEKKLLTYILANSMCLKTVRISLDFTNKYKEKKKKKVLMKELKAMARVSETSQLFFSPQLRWRSMKQHPAYQDLLKL